MFHDILQAVVHGLAVGAVLALPALALTLGFSVLGYINFAVAGMVTAGAFAGYWANTVTKLPLPLCMLIAALAAGALGLAIDLLAIRPIRRVRRTDTAMMVAIATIALNLVVENVLRGLFGNDLRSYDLPLQRDVEWATLQFNPQQLNNLAAAVTVLVALFGFIHLTRLGQAMRAMADNMELARLKGIRPERLMLLTSFVAAAVAGAGGVLLGSETSVDPLTGSRLMLMVFAASVVGGLTSISGAVAGALVMGVVGELALLVVVPTYGTAVAFAATLLMLLYRPSGLLGRRT